MERYKKKSINFSIGVENRNLRAYRRSVDRKDAKYARLSILRGQNEQLENLDETMKGVEEVSKPPVLPKALSRLEMLRKWKEEKVLKKKLESKKPSFLVSHVTYKQPPRLTTPTDKLTNESKMNANSRLIKPSSNSSVMSSSFKVQPAAHNTNKQMNANSRLIKPSSNRSVMSSSFNVQPAAHNTNKQGIANQPFNAKVGVKSVNIHQKQTSSSTQLQQQRKALNVGNTNQSFSAWTNIKPSIIQKSIPKPATNIKSSITHQSFSKPATNLHQQRKAPNASSLPKLQKSCLKPLHNSAKERSGLATAQARNEGKLAISRPVAYPSSVHPAPSTKSCNMKSTVSVSKNVKKPVAAITPLKGSAKSQLEIPNSPLGIRTRTFIKEPSFAPSDFVFKAPVNLSQYIFPNGMPKESASVADTVESPKETITAKEQVNSNSVPEDNEVDLEGSGISSVPIKTSLADTETMSDIRTLPADTEITPDEGHMSAMSDLEKDKDLEVDKVVQNNFGECKSNTSEAKSISTPENENLHSAEVISSKVESPVQKVDAELSELLPTVSEEIKLFQTDKSACEDNIPANSVESGTLHTIVEDFEIDEDLYTNTLFRKTKKALSGFAPTPRRSRRLASLQHRNSIETLGDAGFSKENLPTEQYATTASGRIPANQVNKTPLANEKLQAISEGLEIAEDLYTPTRIPRYSKKVSGGIAVTPRQSRRLLVSLQLSGNTPNSSDSKHVEAESVCLKSATPQPELVKKLCSLSVDDSGTSPTQDGTEIENAKLSGGIVREINSNKEMKGRLSSAKVPNRNSNTENDLLFALNTPNRRPTRQQHKVSLLGSPQVPRRFTRSSIKGDLIVFSPSS